MRKALLALSTIILLSEATAAIAAPLCNGDFRYTRGSWIADPSCARNTAQSISTSQNARIIPDRIGAHQESRDEFCRWHNDIQSDVYCAPYKD
ncbi:MAG: hypothetical protein JSR99_07040 [Proteobacteria bacterium]|nr:hypothetical protein [Pseudomonadota bacterium]